MAERAVIPERPDLSELTAEELAPLERLFDPLTPETWRDFARSLYVTLRFLLAGRNGDAAFAALAMELTRGLAADLGGTQPYIPAGAQMLAGARVRRVVELLNQGKTYAEVAQLCGKISERRVRNIQAAWLREQRAARQGRLDLE